MAGNRSLVEPFVVGSNSSSFTRTHVLIDLETEDGNVSEAPNLLAINRTAYALSAVLEQKNSMLPRHTQKRGCISRSPAHMHCNDSRCARSNLASNIGRVKAKGLINIGKHGNCAMVDHSSNHRDPHKCRNNNFLPGANFQRRKSR